MILPGLDLVIVFFALQVHEVQLINEPKFLEELNSAVNSCAINVRLLLAGSLEQRGGVEMFLGCLNDFDESAALCRQTDAFSGQFIYEGPSLRLWKGHINMRPSCNCTEPTLLFPDNFICD